MSQGIFFHCICTNELCSYHNSPLTFYLGFGRYDVARLQPLLLCGACRLPVGVVSGISFIDCTWSYHGLTARNELLQSRPETAQEKPHHFPVKEIAWVWLVVEASEPAPTHHVSVQTVRQLAHMNNPQVKALVDTVARYRHKYQALKAVYRAQRNFH